MSRPYPLPANEPQRLSRLQALAVLDSEAEPLFDALTRTAALVVGVPIALVSLIDADRQWFKSNIGLPGVSETPREVAFCTHAILGDSVFEVPNALDDPRFADNPLVTDDPSIRFYAGAPIALHDGLRMGTLCVIDRQPRELTQAQREVLEQLARVAAEALDQRVLALERNAALQRQAEAERQRAEQHQRIEAILEATQAGTWEWNFQTGETHFNERSAEIIGRSLAELGTTTVQTWLDYIHPDDLARSNARLAQHFRGELPSYEFDARMRHADGRWVWVQARGRVVSWTAAGRPEWIYGIHVDVTERKLAERRLRASEAFLDRTGRLAAVGGWEVDLHSNEITWSDQTCRIYDRPAGYQPTRQEAREYFAPAALATIDVALQRALGGGGGWDFELPLTTAIGRAIWVRVMGSVDYRDGKPRRLVGALQDITFHKRAAEALELSERRFRKLFQYSLGLICTHDLDGIVLSVNPAAARSLGYSLAEVIGRSLTELMQPQYHPRFTAYLARIQANGSDSGLFRLRARDGSQHTWQYHNVLDADGEDAYVLGHAQDITEREHHEKQLRALSIRDPLTGCFNRRYLAELAAGLAQDAVWGAIAIDLDRFKQVNDMHGHQRGDEVLIAMGRFLEGCVGDAAIVLRVGGDEFLVFAPEADAGVIADLAGRIDAARASAPIGFSLGHASGRGAQALDATLSRADERLYRSRAEQRGAPGATPG